MSETRTIKLPTQAHKIIKDYEENPVAFFDGEGVLYSCNYIGNHSTLVLRDSDTKCRSEYVLENKQKKLLCAIPTDSGNESNCDYVVINLKDSNIYFVELKSQLDNNIITKASKQIKETIQQWKEMFPYFTYYARVVYDNQHKDFMGDEEKRLGKAFLKDKIKFEILQSPQNQCKKQVEII